MRLLSTLFLAGLFVVGVSSEMIAQPITNLESWDPDSIVRLPVVGSPAISADGAAVAYTVREALVEGEESRYLSHVWVSKTDGSMNRQFTRGDESCHSPEFSPDGKWLSFISNRNGSPQVYRMHLDGGEAEKITSAETGVRSYQWSPDGKYLAYTMTDPKSEEQVKREREKRDVILVDQDFNFSRLYVQPMDDKESAKKIYEDDLHTVSYDWSPDGESIVFAHWPTPRTNDRYRSNISVVPADSGEVSPLVHRPGIDTSPQFTPDGNYIVFSSNGGELEAIGLQDLFIVSAEGGEPRALPHTYDRNVSIVGFASGGEDVLVQETRRTVSALYRVPLDGGEVKQVTPEDGVYSSFTVNKKGTKVVFGYENSDVPREIYISELDRFSKIQLSTHFNQIEMPGMGRTEVLTWNSPDGTEVEGLLTYPVGYEEGDQVPLILMVHGGPAGVYSQTWSGAAHIYPLQYFAEQGYALLRPNFRGSRGYGKEFRYANVRDWGYGDYDDLMSGVDLVIGMGVAHPDSLVEMGWSYGGYMTSFLVTRTDRFKAVSMGAGLSNLVSMLGTSDIPDYLIGHMEGPYWDGNMDPYERHSAIYHVDNVSTPVQVIHGQNDIRVPLGQGQEFYYAMRERGVETEMILYPRTPHSPSEPKFLADVPQRILKWFDKHLGRD